MNINENNTPVNQKLNGNVSLGARSYQTELMEQAKSENLIICLPTGSGKTYIAVMLIKEMSHSIRQSIKMGGKRTVFLVKTVQLAQQQTDYLRSHIDLKIGTYYGELGVDLWENQKWLVEVEKNNILVFTAQVFLNLIDHGFFSLKQINLLIFDECHHATGLDQYPMIMNKHYDDCSDPPRILGLTASIAATKLKPEKLKDYANVLEKTYRARLTFGVNRDEAVQYGTSATVEKICCLNYRDQIKQQNESLMIPFDFLKQMKMMTDEYLSKTKTDHDDIENELSRTMLTKDYCGKDIMNYQSLSEKYMKHVNSNTSIVAKLKHYLENLIEVGYELGIYGLHLFVQVIRGKVETERKLGVFLNATVKDLFEHILQRLECLSKDILENIILLYAQENQILFSEKVVKLFNRITKEFDGTNEQGRCIVFVERIYTATFLSKILTKIVKLSQSSINKKLQIQHITGAKSTLHDKPITAKAQRRIIKGFRLFDIHVLIATAVVEEGLDIPQCNLVVRFNKPNNFSSYMQSKGRARAKNNACYVLLMDDENTEAYNRDQQEYRDYESIEKMLQAGIINNESDDDFDDDGSQIESYRPSPGVVIDAIRAVLLIVEYCAILGNGQVFPPRFLYYRTNSKYKCILSMPANCPVREDIICEQKRKKLAKHQCCLEMVKKLHKEDEFDEYCLPRRNKLLLNVETPLKIKIFKLVDELFEEKSDSSFEKYQREISKFPKINKNSSSNWHLYKINNELGFIVPKQDIKIPKFHIYDRHTTIIINILYLKSIDYQQHKDELMNFSRYLFEDTFYDMNTDSMLLYDIENSEYKLFPCLLMMNNEIDWVRMRDICQRKQKFLDNYSNLNHNEIYCASHLTNRNFYSYVSDESCLKRTSDSLPFKTKKESIQTYADYFEDKVPNVRIRRDLFLASMKNIRIPRINYLKRMKTDTNDMSNETQSAIIHYPIELIIYGPLNRTDLEMIYKLPSILVRISQLYQIEQLRKKLARNISCYSFKDVDEMSIVTFTSCFENKINSLLLPLSNLNYDDMLTNESNLQPTTEILFESVTRHSADENFDMENLEILGDCFLKFAVSMSLYQKYPSASAGALTIEKAKQISNKNLYRIVVEKDIKNYLYAMKIDFRGKIANWIPPGYKLKQDIDIKTSKYIYQEVKRKSFADMLEALIGAYLISTNYGTTLKFMKWLDLNVIPYNDRNEIMPVPMVCNYLTNSNANEILENFYNEQGFNIIEHVIKYQFKNKAYLIAAFTHPSSFANRLTICYERLEFLGDAVLDFLLTRYIFVSNANITPSLVTDIRQDLANNGRLAYILVATRLHTKILHNSPDLFNKISNYVNDDDLFPNGMTLNELLNKDIDTWADSTAPKALADVFEALVGAIFLDSNKSLDTVWKSIEPLFKGYILRSINDPNLNPIKSFFENGGKFIDAYSDPAIEQTTENSICIVETKDGRQFKGFGRNKKMARYDACQKANEFLRRTE